MTYQEAKQYKEDNENVLKVLSENLRKFSSGSMGLVSDEVRKTTEYIQAKNAYDIQFKLMQTINAWFVKEFKKEYAAERKAKLMGK